MQSHSGNKISQLRNVCASAELLADLLPGRISALKHHFSPSRHFPPSGNLVIPIATICNDRGVRGNSKNHETPFRSCPRIAASSGQGRARNDLQNRPWETRKVFCTNGRGNIQQQRVTPTSYTKIRTTRRLRLEVVRDGCPVRLQTWVHGVAGQDLRRFARLTIPVEQRSKGSSDPPSALPPS